MGVEVVAAEMAQEPVKAVTETRSKENGKLDKSLAPNKTIKFGSHGDEPAKGAVATDSNVPKDAAFEWPAPKAVHTFYFVRYRPYDDPKIRAKFDVADKELHKKNQVRAQITDELRVKRSEKSELLEQLRDVRADGRQFRSILDEKRKEMEPLQNALGELRNTGGAGRNRGGICSSEEELNDLIKSLQYRIQHESIPLTEEKQILREIKQLEGTRGKVKENVAKRAEIQDSLGQKEVIQDQVKLMVADLDGVRKDHQGVRNKIARLDEKLKAVNAEIDDLQQGLKAVIEKRNKAYETIQGLRKQREEENSFFKQSREVVAQAKQLATAEGDKQKEAILELEKLSHSEVDKFVALYSKDKSLREDYERRILPSLDMRQLSRDGRMRNPNEKPILATEAPATEPEIVVKAPVKRPKEETKTAPQESQKPQKESNNKVAESKAKSDADKVDDEEIFVVEKPLKDTSEDKKIDEAKLKEMKRDEEIAKAKQAMERKKKLAEKAAAKAAIRAQKEAEKKLKDREKKAKKKAGASASTTEPEDAGASAEATETENAEVDVEPSPLVKEKLQKETSVRNRRSNAVDSVPRRILKRKKLTNYYWMFAAGGAAVAILVLGYYYYYLN